jgi:hypothetical protein
MKRLLSLIILFFISLFLVGSVSTVSAAGQYECKKFNFPTEGIYTNKDLIFSVDFYYQGSTLQNVKDEFRLAYYIDTSTLNQPWQKDGITWVNNGVSEVSDDNYRLEIKLSGTMIKESTNSLYLAIITEDILNSNSNAEGNCESSAQTVNILIDEKGAFGSCEDLNSPRNGFTCNVQINYDQNGQPLSPIYTTGITDNCDLTGTELVNRVASLCNGGNENLTNLYTSKYPSTPLASFSACLSCGKNVIVDPVPTNDLNRGDVCNSNMKPGDICSVRFSLKCANFKGQNICLANGTAGAGDICKIGANECNSSLTCVKNNGSNVTDWTIGEEGKCKGKEEVQYISCANSTDAFCDEKAKDLGYIKGDCNSDQVCIFYQTEQEVVNNSDNFISKPVPPHKFIDKCIGDLSCANCVARKADGSAFSSYNEAAEMEYEYNQKIDQWLADRDKQIDYDPPKVDSYGLKYTGLIYTSLGCVDTTDSGLLTRVVQIALGITGAVILVRFGQAAIKLQGGGSPEDRAEGVEIISSAVVALLLFTMSIIGLRFLGINVLQIFSPGTVEFAPDNP